MSMLRKGGTPDEGRLGSGIAPIGAATPDGLDGRTGAIGTILAVERRQAAGQVGRDR
jgi:hypothetical protein